MFNLSTRSLLWRALAPAIALFVTLVHGQAATTSNLFHITAGRYTSCCGIAGPFTQELPDVEQSFVSLVIDSNQLSATMTILRDDQQTVFRTFENGRVFADYIEFGSPVPPVPPSEATQLHYIVSNDAAGLRFDGVIEEPMSGADIPNYFTHTNVTAVPVALPPQATIRVSEVEICWPGELNHHYQLEYRSAFTTNTWVPLGAPVTGNGGTNCVHDPLPPGEPRRFYRVTNAP